jgi:pimeloyl-ACP methyl ester carboxylesterase
MSNFLLVHGAWHSATHWNKVEEHLTAMGHRVHAIDLPGSGLDAGYPQAYLRGDVDALATEPSPIGGVHLSDYRDAIVAQVRRSTARSRSSATASAASRSRRRPRRCRS